MSFDNALMNLIQSFYNALNLQVGIGNSLSIFEYLQEVLHSFLCRHLLHGLLRVSL